ncbi:MAG: L,D-transpeptidase [Ignavibacteriaceae bacterium]|nr:L,D-transpeptidase [Ignavibacteriaceae bacterium]
MNLKYSEIKVYISKFFRLINPNTIQNVILFTGGIILFIAGVIIYGIIINFREVTLSDAMHQKGLTQILKPSILVDRKNFSLNLYDDTLFVKSYRASFGRNTQSAKQKKGDNATPVGQYKICSIDTAAKYYKFFKFNYPNLEDAVEALRKGIINQQTFDKIKFEYYYEDCTSIETPLGGNIGIHGLGKLDYFFKNLPFVYNWTDGSIAISNESIDELYTVVKKGTKVVIR